MLPAGGQSEYPPMGASDDLLSILARAESLRYARQGVVMPAKPASRRAWVEPLGNLAGLAFHAVTALVPIGRMNAVQDFCFGKLAAPDVFPLEAGSPRLAEARELASELEAAAGGPPAILGLFSHPPATGKWLNLNIELTRQMLWALSQLRPGPSRVQLVVAVDPFALDGFGLLAEAGYAAYMGRRHLGFDRLASSRSGLSRSLVGFTSWSRIGHRLVRALNRRGEVAIPPAGGVPTTTRGLYAAKEFLAAMRGGRPPGRTPGEVFDRLVKESPDFAAFCLGGLTGEKLRRSRWRMLEAWVLATLTGAWNHDFEREGVPSVDSGVLTVKGRSALRACMAALGYDLAAVEKALPGFEEEFRRETPYRRRLFRMLARRVVARGTPLLLVPLSHGVPPDVAMTWGEPWGVTAGGGVGEVTVWRPGSQAASRVVMSVEAAAREIGRANFL